MSSAAPPCTLIIGGGHAGSEAAMALRQQGYEGRIVLISEESGLPYQRPPLSKGFLAGTVTAQALPIRPDAAYEKAAVERLSDVRALAIDVTAKTVSLDNGNHLGYDHLILATGSRSRRLGINDLEEPLADNLHYLRTLADAERLRDQLAPDQRLVVVGGGYIGLEVAAAARQAGLHVTVLEAQSRILARVTAHEVSTFYQAAHREAGIELLVDIQLKQIILDPTSKRVIAVLSNDGTRHEADLVLVGIGAEPNVELAVQAGLDVDNGIVVDEFTRTSQADIYAIGDCSRHPSALYNRPLRLESIPNAVEQARTAASAIVGKLTPYHSLPWFWSDQYDLKLQIAGLSQGYDQVIVRGKSAQRSFIAFYFQAGKLIAADCINRQQEFAMAKKLVLSGYQGLPQQLADPELTLKDIALQFGI